MRLIRNIMALMASCLAIAASLSSCNDRKSYADLLRDETKYINNFLADQRVEGNVPSDSVFITRQGIAEDIYKKSSHPEGVDHDEEIGKIMNEIAQDPSKDAPFYRMDEDGNVYMKVVRTGDMKNRPKYDDLVYLRFLRYNLASYNNGVFSITPEGNATDVTYSVSIRYGNYKSVSSSSWGEGIQLPLNYLGFGCEVELVMRSQVGMSSEIASVTPFLYTVRYFKSNI